MTINMNGLAEAKMKWFSVRIFLITLIMSLGWTGAMVASRTRGTYQEVSHEVGMIMAMLTLMIVLLAILCLCEGNWQPDPRPWSDRTYVSGRAWVSMALALPITNIFLLLQ